MNQLPVFGAGGATNGEAGASAGAAANDEAALGGQAGISNASNSNAGNGSVAGAGGDANESGAATGGTLGVAGSDSSAGAPGVGGASIIENGGFISPTCPDAAAFCDSFEDDELARPPQSPWEPSTNGASAEVNAQRSFSGARALLINVPSGPPPHRGYMALHQNNFPAATRDMYGRLMVWLEATPTAAQGNVHWTLFQGEGRAATNNYNAIYRFGGQEQAGTALIANYETTQDGNPPVRSNCYQHSATRMPTQRWTCIEWHLAGDTNEAQYWLDGRDLADIHVIDRSQACLYDEPPLNGQWLAPPAFQTLYIGWEQYSAATNPVNVWIDSLVVATTRVGCPEPG